MMIPVFITTHKRPQSCLALLKQIARENEEHGDVFHVFAIHDLCDNDYSDCEDFAKARGWFFDHTNAHHGRSDYHKLISRFGAYMRFSNAPFFVFLQDDIELLDGFYKSIKSLVAKLHAPDLAVLNLHVDKARHDGWTNQPWTDVEMIRGKYVDKLGWFDLAAFVGTREAFRVVDFRCPTVSSVTSSGVPAAWSKALAEHDLSMFRVKTSLVRCLDVPTVMHEQTNDFMRLTSETVL